MQFNILRGAFEFAAGLDRESWIQGLLVEPSFSKTPNFEFWLKIWFASQKFKLTRLGSPT